MANGVIEYQIDDRVSAFTAPRDSVLPYHVIQAHQVHSDKIARITSSSYAPQDLEGVDAIVTDLADVAVGARTADCIPILLWDPVNRAVAAVHSGWRGTVLRISGKTLKTMRDSFGTNPADVKALIGPGIGPLSFQVGEEVCQSFSDAGFDMSLISRFAGPKVSGNLQTGWHVDLWLANRIVLQDCGVRSGNIQVVGLCTYANNTLFYSARREGPKCGRNITSIKILPV